MAIDWSQCPAVESIPGKLSGAWVLRGTRMPVSVIFENLEAGANIDDIMNWFEGLDRSQVKAVIQFAARSLDENPGSVVVRRPALLLGRCSKMNGCNAGLTATKNCASLTCACGQVCNLL